MILLVALILFADILPSEGEPVTLKTRLYTCCNKFLGNGCDESITVWCDDETTIDFLRTELVMSWDNIKSFCGCP